MLTFRGVTVRYGDNGQTALSDLNLSVEPGQIVALVGPSGAGKSTILGLAAGLVLPSEGTVEVMGVDTSVLGRRRYRSVRAEIGTIHQSFALVGPLRVAHNVAAGRLGRWGWPTVMRSLIRPVAIDEIADSLERVGIGDKLWDRTDRLSGGQQQRVAIARTLFQYPDLFLADEPCSALDPARADAVMEVLTSAVNGSSDRRALITSLHDAPLATRHCHRVIGLRDGIIEFDLPASEVSDTLLTELYALERDAPVGDALEEAVRR